MLLPIWFFLLPQTSAGGREIPSSRDCALPRQLKSLPVLGGALPSALPLPLNCLLLPLVHRVFYLPGNRGTRSLSVWPIMIITKDINQMSFI